MQARLERLRQKMKQEGLLALLITNLKNIYYLTGFWGTAGTVLVTEDRQVLITDDRYITYAQSVVTDFEVVSNRDALSVVAQVLKDANLRELAFEDEVSVAYYHAMQTVFERMQLTPTTGVVMGLRMIKDEVEVATIQRACQISDQAFLDALDFIKPGKTEIEVANFLDFRMREMGSEAVSFDTIVASGYRSAMPHGRASNKVIATGDALTLDFGCIYNHYVSDMTRTIYVGSVSDEEAEIYQTVLAANQALIAEAKAGMEYREFDGVPRRVIERAGYGSYFTHGIGHGMGLDVHELPYFRQTATDTIQAGMVLTDEPGIYLEGKYGVRIEDDLLITDTGCTILTRAPKELIVI
ncbi:MULTISPECIES: Xaa-Pro peptidase family protein [unclassified Streptococcus]|uniref:M24 family metallopeptidase n=1 Tax=unclassified Streptococcus TaxID=2608887 RepID=UPI001072AC3E|nr:MULTISPECIES: Xaa-Pro peptidase family protein [unclassified Streptococcus]MBF0787918.1 aminopeptidase P family protein [Streptococcus sp. 19428wC2_LYSM12]MCQ9211282.1 Xaa-Pro peptidase family protein [Streptococcus sp. B01]MCQ9214595.1 Xaa-Pro peptidase family protein [Streptococcus sp. O1]TFV05038.1 aminopeptidase P family protein [Streptococcus sp. LYSM12]